MKPQSSFGGWFILLAVYVFGVSPAFSADTWHNQILRSPWERDRNEQGGDGSQIPRALVYSPKNSYQTVFMGVDTAGVYRSDDSGATWTSKMKGINVYFIKSLAVDPQNPDVVYALASTGNGVQIAQNGLYVSSDNGENWSLQYNFNVANPPENAHAIAIDPASYNGGSARCLVVYVGTSTGLYKTTNGGSTYAVIGTGSVGTKRIASVDVHPTNSAIITVATYNGVYRSTDSGATFSDISSGLPTYDSTYAVAVDTRINALAVDPVDPTIMYAAFDDPLARTYKLFKKTGVSSWTQLTTGVPIKGRFFDIMVHPAAPNKLLLGVEWGWPYRHPYYSDNSGQTWQETYLGKVVEDRFNLSDGDTANGIFSRAAFAPKPTDGSTWLGAMNYGAIFKTTDSALTWHWSNTNYGGGRLANFSFNGAVSRHMVFGGTDLGVITSFDGGSSFTKAKIVALPGNQANATAVGIEPGSTNPDTAYVLTSIGGASASAAGNLEESFDGGRTFIPVVGTNGTQASGIFWHPTNPNYIYAGTWVSSNGGSTWTTVVDPFRLSEAFSGVTPPNLPSGWTFSTIGQATSSVVTSTFKAPNVSDNKLEFTINQTTAFGSLPLVDYTAKTLNFTTTPIFASATLDSGIASFTQQVLQLDNGSGSFVYVFIQNNGNGTSTTKYRIKDGAYDSGEVTLTSTFASLSVGARLILAPKYLQISCGANITVFHDFVNTSNYRIRLVGRSAQINTPVKTYADNVAFYTLPVQIVGYDLTTPQTVYGYDSMSVYKSTDVGATWTRQLTHATPDNTWFGLQLLGATAMNAAGTKIYMGHNGGVYVYDVATNTETFKTTANGFVLNQGSALHISRIAIDPNNDQIVYAGEFNILYGNGKWVFKSTDGGNSWAPMSTTGLFGNGRVWGMNVDFGGRLFAGSDHGSFWYGDVPSPAAPTGLAASTSNGAANLVWSASPGATTYQVTRSTSSGGPFVVVRGGVSSTSFADTGIESGVTYYYKVSASNLGGASTWSSAASVTTSQALLLDAPFTGSNGTLPSGWAYTGSGSSSANISGNVLRHLLNPSVAWGGTSKVTYSNQLYEFYSAPLWVEAYLDVGTTPISQSGIQMSDVSGNYVQLFQSGNRMFYRIKDGSYDSLEIDLGTLGGANYATLKMKLSSSGIAFYRNGTLVATVSYAFTNRRLYKPELIARCGTVATNVAIYADNLRLWKDKYVAAIDGVAGALPIDWENVGPASSPGSISGGALRLAINQSAPFSANASVRKLDRTFSFDSGALNVEAFMRADPFAGTATQCMLNFQQKGTPNKIYFFVQNSGAVSYRIVDGEYDSGEVPMVASGANSGTFRVQISPTAVSIYRDGALLGSTIAHTFINQQDYSLSFIGRCSVAASNVYVTVDDVNVY